MDDKLFALTLSVVSALSTLACALLIAYVKTITQSIDRKSDAALDGIKALRGEIKEEILPLRKSRHEHSNIIGQHELRLAAIERVITT